MGMWRGGRCHDTTDYILSKHAQLDSRNGLHALFPLAGRDVKFFTHEHPHSPAKALCLTLAYCRERSEYERGYSGHPAGTPSPSIL